MVRVVCYRVGSKRCKGPFPFSLRADWISLLTLLLSGYMDCLHPVPPNPVPPYLTPPRPNPPQSAPPYPTPPCPTPVDQESAMSADPRACWHSAHTHAAGQALSGKTKKLLVRLASRERDRDRERERERSR